MKRISLAQRLEKFCMLLIIASMIGIMVKALNPSEPKIPDDDYPRSKAVKLTNGHMMCSGEQVEGPSGMTYILTAAHCREIADETGSMQVIDANGRTLQRKIIAEDPNADLLLLEGLPNMTGLKIAKKSPMPQHVRTFTHGHDFDTYKTEGQTIMKRSEWFPLCDPGEPMLPNDKCKCNQPKNKIAEVQDMFGRARVCLVYTVEEAMTAQVVPGSSGGMVVDDNNELTGVVSATDDMFGYMTDSIEINKFMAAY